MLNKQKEPSIILWDNPEDGKREVLVGADQYRRLLAQRGKNGLLTTSEYTFVEGISVLDGMKLVLEHEALTPKQYDELLHSIRRLDPSF